MRVIAGKAKGFNLDCPDGLNTRPTSDRAREALFSMLDWRIPECDFLDVFSGSGAVGIEALSRGAESSVFVDNSGIAATFILKNLMHTKLHPCAYVYEADYKDALNKLSTLKRQFDIIFMDPPYKSGLIEKTLDLIYSNKLLKNGGIIVAEMETNDEASLPPEFKMLSERAYGRAKFIFIGGVS